MKHIINLVFAGVLACCAQAVHADDGAARGARESMESSEPYLNMAALAAAVERHGFVVAAPKPRESESLLEILGLAGRAPFPSRGGPLD